MSIFQRGTSNNTNPDSRDQFKPLNAEEERKAFESALGAIRELGSTLGPNSPNGQMPSRQDQAKVASASDQLLSFSFKASSRPAQSQTSGASVAPEGEANPQAPTQPVARPQPQRQLPSLESEENDLTIRRGMTLKGEISSCERVVIQGCVEACVTDCQKLEILENGTFKGSATVVDAEIAGELTGTLRVENKLVVRSTARIVGTVYYGSLIVDEGCVLRATFQDITPAERTDQPADAFASGAPSDVAAE